MVYGRPRERTLSWHEELDQCLVHSRSTSLVVLSKSAPPAQPYPPQCLAALVSSSTLSFVSTNAEHLHNAWSDLKLLQIIYFCQSAYWWDRLSAMSSTLIYNYDLKCDSMACSAIWGIKNNNRNYSTNYCKDLDLLTFSLWSATVSLVSHSVANRLLLLSKCL